MKEKSSKNEFIVTEHEMIDMIHQGNSLSYFLFELGRRIALRDFKDGNVDRMKEAVLNKIPFVNDECRKGYISVCKAMKGF